jgi:hypothetical protein
MMVAMVVTVPWPGVFATWGLAKHGFVVASKVTVVSKAAMLLRGSILAN